jgi:hypothetical protein
MLVRVSSYELTEWVEFLKLEAEDQKAEEQRQQRGR